MRTTVTIDEDLNQRALEVANLAGLARSLGVLFQAARS